MSIANPAATSRLFCGPLQLCAIRASPLNTNGVLAIVAAPHSKSFLARRFSVQRLFAGALIGLFQAVALVWGGESPSPGGDAALLVQASAAAGEKSEVRPAA